MRCVRCGWPSKNYEMSNDGRPAVDPYARLDAAYLLGALDADEQRPETGTPGNGRARRHSGRRHHRPAVQIMGYRDRPDLLVPTRRCRAAE
jgi:hypothetical protein